MKSCLAATCIGICIILMPAFASVANMDMGIEIEKESIAELSQFLPRESAHDSLNHNIIQNLGQISNRDIMYYSHDNKFIFTDYGVWIDIGYQTMPDDERHVIYGQSNGFKPERYAEDKLLEQICSDMDRDSEDSRIISKQSINLLHRHLFRNEVQPIGVKRLEQCYNYFLGDDPQYWRTSVPSFEQVVYYNVWNGIDIKYYITPAGLKYDVIVHPGGDVDHVRMCYSGATDLGIGIQGDLIIHTPMGHHSDSGLILYQEEGPKRTNVEGSFKLLDDTSYGFSVTSDYQKDRTLIIDPTFAPMLSNSTLIGGNGDEVSYSVGIDHEGRIYLVGETDSFNFPTTPGTYAQVKEGLKDIFVSIFNSNGTELISSTYIGGDLDDRPTSLIVSDNGTALVVGTTKSSDFPTTFGAFGTIRAGLTDGVLFELRDYGTTLSFSTLLGGTGSETISDIAIEDSGDIILIGYTNSTDFPNTTGAYDNTYNGGGWLTGDGFISRMDPVGENLLASSYLGGESDDFLVNVIIHSSGEPIAVGYSQSTLFPTTSGVFDETKNSFGWDVIVVRFDSDLTDLRNCTLFGGDSWDYGYGIEELSDGNIAIVGKTNADSSDFPLTFNAVDSTSEAMEYEGYLAVFDPSLSTLTYSTFIGGDDYDGVSDLAVGSDMTVAITGYTTSSNFHTSDNAYDSIMNPGYSAFLSVFTIGEADFIYSTYFGGQGDDFAYEICADNRGGYLITGYTSSPDYPSITGGYQTELKGDTDAFLSKFLFPYISITSPILLSENETVDTVYSRLCPYIVSVNITNAHSLDDLNYVELYLDPDNLNIGFSWDSTSGEFSTISNPGEMVSLSDLNSAYNDGEYTWTLEFSLYFNWNYSRSTIDDIRIVTRSDLQGTFSYTAPFQCNIINKLDFINELTVLDEKNRDIKESQIVRGGSDLLWKGLIPVYQGTDNVFPPPEEYNVTLWDEEGNSWADSPAIGEPISIASTASLFSQSDGIVHVINFSGIPPQCDVSTISFSIRVDAENVTFLKMGPFTNEWITTQNVVISTEIMDVGGSEVNGDTVMFSVSNDNGTKWSDWNRYVCNSSWKVKCTSTIQLAEGDNNLVKWRASDLVGNGPTDSREHRISVDSISPIFSDSYPIFENVSRTLDVHCGVTISDETSGINASTIGYCKSLDDGQTWTDWMTIEGHSNGKVITLSITERFLNGNNNLIKWRASDLAGNGPIESAPYSIAVDLIPNVNLLSPVNGSIIRSATVKFAWEQTTEGLSNVSFDVYCDVFYPPTTLIGDNVKANQYEFTGLQHDLRYYWMVKPSSTTTGDSIRTDQIWEFQTNISDLSSIYKIRLIDMEKVTVETGKSTFTMITVVNDGSYSDMIRIFIDPGRLANQVTYDLDEIMIAANSSEVIAININIDKDTIADEYPILINVTSINAQEEGIEVTDNMTLIIDVIKKQDMTDRENNKSENFVMNLMIITVIVLSTLLILFMVMFLRSRSKQKDSQIDSDTQKKILRAELVQEPSIVQSETIGSSYTTEGTSLNSISEEKEIGTLPPIKNEDITDETIELLPSCSLKDDSVP